MPLGAILGGAAKMIGGALASKAKAKIGRVIAGKSKTASAILGGATGASAAMTVLPRVLPAVGGVARSAAGAVGRVARSPLGQGVIGGAAGSAIVGYLADGTPVMGRRRRGRGFTARDIRQTRRMLRLIKEMQGCIPKRKC